MCFGAQTMTNSAGQSIDSSSGYMSGVGTNLNRNATEGVVSGANAGNIRDKILLSNWMTAGGPPKAIDPTVEYARMNHLAGQYAAASRGAEQGGQFNLQSGINGTMPPIPAAPAAGAGTIPGAPTFPGFPGGKAPFGGPR